MEPLGDDAAHQPSAAGTAGAGPLHGGHAAGLGVTRASAEEWLQVEEWAAEEQWNPGLGDTACFHPTDPDGFFLGRQDGRPVSAVSVVNYSDEYAFLGYYLVHPALRGKGIGMATWQAAVPHADGRTIGLDAVPAQEETYRRSGFAAAYRTGRYGGRPASPGVPSPSVEPVTEDHLKAIAAYDETCFPAPRKAFLGRWLSAPGHRAHVCVRNGEPAGYGVIRQARNGHRIGPLFADTPQIAEAVFDTLIAHLGPEDEVHIDIPETHAAAVGLATSRGLELGSETVRMYKGDPPGTRAERVFGVTSLELG
ncbi:GNAT family N-acetyltransferase [Streptomyces sp. WMMB 322]|uniref:GNAT family N-acetyltransferase n=1 Tax=Streptomyces sp. WMMB 322 TaxID=1286821 RepID=UPI0006E35765|nr:GNAT family N-acetyltransferase [Streptomyces sp. WMMB 322]SCK57749.1 Acetyltransferase (GNAT) domain-containing protein [Streptomyces sp. WMMB 322]